MKSDFEKVYHQLEKKHFWFRSRRRYIVQSLKDLDKDAMILDIGCSSGILLDELAQVGFKPNNLYGIDISEKAISNCKSAGFEKTFVMDAQKIDLTQKFDIIIASDCLEHLKDDKKALNNWHNLLKARGIAYIFVPAFMSLWSEHDEVNMHYRRYKRSDLTSKLIENGFEIAKSSYWNFFLFAPIFLVRFIGRLKFLRKKDTGDLDKLPLFNNLLFALLSFENKLLQHINFPIGVSTYCIAKKTSSGDV